MITITREQAQKIIDAADEVITALAGTNEDVHPDNSTKVVRLYDDLNDHYAPPEVVRELARIALAALTAESVAVVVDANEYGSDGNLTHQRDIDYFQEDVDSIPAGTKLYAAQPAPVSVPDEKHSERFEWTYGQWAEHLGGRHQNNDPANYYEFGSFMAVAEMLRQFGNVQRKAGWNACRAAMLQGDKS